jgi:hypothetical protein
MLIWVNLSLVKFIMVPVDPIDLCLFYIQEHLSVFVLNGYEELENFHDLDESELDYLGITEPSQRAKIMTAVELMQDNTCKLIFLDGFHIYLYPGSGIRDQLVS